MDKKEARSYFSQKRNQLSEKEIESNSLKILNQLIKSGFTGRKTFHIFLSIPEKKEVNTLPIINFLLENKKLIYCPKVEKDSLDHYLLTPETKLKPNKWGIPEPYENTPIILTSLDCVLIPLLAYDRQGNRVGYGKGYYDRFLYDFPQARKIGLSFFNPVDTIEGFCESDISLDYIITPTYFSGFPMEEK